VTPGQPDWVPPDVDTRRANPARVYDYLLGGTHNFLADQDVARAMTAIDPNIRSAARANRAFIERAVRFLAGSGIRQFLDIGSGIPTEGNVHEIAHQAAPGSHVVYVEVDPVAVAHSRALLAGNDNAEIVDADLRDPGAILANEQTRRLIDFSQPVGLLLSGVLHFISDDDNPWRITRTLRDALASGSYLVLGHGSHDGTVTRAVLTAYNRSVSTPSNLRARDEILRFFEGFDLVEPGLVPMTQWRPDSPQEVPAGDSPFWVLVGVARKP
jgi:hypothetical protein